MILFFIILFYSLYTINNKLIKFRIIKNPVIESEELINYELEEDEEAIEVVSSNLGGNDPDTDQHYANTTTYEKLRKYNSYIKRYPEQVMKIMDDIQANLVEEIPKNENQTLTKINNV